MQVFDMLCLAAVYKMSFQNGTGAPMDGFMIQFNKNSFGLAPANQNIPVGSIAAGATSPATLPLSQNAGMLSPAAMSPVLQVRGHEKATFLSQTQRNAAVT